MNAAMTTRRCRALTLTLIVVCMLAATVAGRADAAPAGPVWTLSPVAQPTNLAPSSTYASGGDTYVITATNIGATGTDGSVVTITDTLPAGVTPDPSGASLSDPASSTSSCSAAGEQVTCTDDESGGSLVPGEQIQVTIPVDVTLTSPASVTNAVTISGGGASKATASAPTTVSSTPAPFGLTGFTAAALNADGTPDTTAGSHPFEVVTGFSVNTAQGTSGSVVPAGNLRTASVALPPGLVGAPTAVPSCPRANFDSSGALAPGFDSAGCPTDTQVGVAEVSVDEGSAGNASESPQFAPIYNVAPPTGVAAELAFHIVSSEIRVDFSVRTGSDYGLTATIDGINSGAPVYATTIILWGDPADPGHDASRFAAGAFSPGNGSGGGLPSGAPASGFITTPTRCGTGTSASLEATDWQDPTTTVTGTPAAFPAMIGCDSEPFAPTLSATPDTTAADSPTGLSLDLHVPQPSGPDAIASGALQDATITLPPGMRVSPSGANGLQACAPGQIALGDDATPTCPAASTIGTVEIDSPLLPDPLLGSAYLAQQTDNPFGSLLAIYLDAQADGVQIKLAGQVTADPVTGQLTVAFPDDPQLPFSDIKVDLDGGPNALLSSPASCGTESIASSLTSSSGAVASPSSAPFSFTSGCVTGFAPTFVAGTANAQAGAYSPLSLTFSRQDIDEELSGLTTRLPRGLLANLGDATQCSETTLDSISTQPGTGAAQLADPSCPASSQVGTVAVSAGPGNAPDPLSGRVYLTGPYEGEPYGLAEVVPAVAGPIDLGSVIVRQSIAINPRTAQVTVRSDPFPTIIDGIPLQIRSVSVDLNRPGFTVNPTSCDPTAVTGMLTSAEGAAVPVRSRFEVGGCTALHFAPRLGLTLHAHHATRPGSHPRLIARLTVPSGQANVSAVSVTLPLSLALDPGNTTHVCSVAAAARIDCPARTVVGGASAHARILPGALRGRVFLVQGIRYGAHHRAIRTLPSLLVALRGRNGVAIDLTAGTSVNAHAQLVATFASIPDAAVASFDLTITGGRHGILVVSGSHGLCAQTQRGQAVERAHSGARHAAEIRVTTPACRGTVTRHHGDGRSGA